MCNIQWILPLLTIICYLATVNCYFLSPNDTLARFKRQSKCKATEHQCGSGECISDDTICDGREDCRDGSDESSCRNFPCQSYLFKCAYGACINSDFECDGKKDCKDNSDEMTPKCANSATPATNCGTDQFACTSGECIDDFDLCDGKPNCRDGSDETVKACGNLRCFDYNFKCAYGACINADLRCNNKKDCADGSDELNCGEKPGGGTTKKPPTSVTTKPPPVATPTPPTSIPGGCKLPTMENGSWTVLGGATSYSPGQFVAASTILSFKCNTQYGLFPETASVSVCNNGEWSVVPKCLQTCPPLESTRTYSATCYFNDSLINCKMPYDGTVARFSCAPLYEDLSLERRPSRFCSDGSWDSLPHCEPVCGAKSVDAQTLVVGGKVAKKGEYPWQVGIYTAVDKKHICGGSIITPKITLSAAHCFAEADESKYLLAAGKFYRAYEDARDEEAQYSKIKKLIIHNRYNNGIPYYAYDIAVLVLETPFKLTKFVLPVCTDYNLQFDHASLVNETGIVSGWGYTASTGQPSEVLKYLEVNYKSESGCTLPNDFLPYYTYVPDKLCAGLMQQGQSACQGDSGGGLVFPMKNRYYIRGIVSVAPRKADGGCDENHLTLYTAVAHHTEYIQNIIFQNKGNALT